MDNVGDVALEEMAFPGLHGRVMSLLPQPFGSRRAIDLGCGTGAFATRLAAAGWQAEGADIDKSRFGADLPFHVLDLNEAPALPGAYDLVTAVEVIEHTENPTGTLRTVAHLLLPDGLAVVTTPNLDSIYSRCRFLFRGKLKAMDEWGDPTHISPIFLSILPRLLTRADLRLDRVETHNALAGRPAFRPIMRALGHLGSAPGDSLILFLRHR